MFRMRQILAIQYAGRGRPIGDMDNREKQTVINEALGEFLHVMMWRRSLHQHPELSFEEHRTSKVVAEALQHEGIEYRSVAGTGVLAVSRGRRRASAASGMRSCCGPIWMRFLLRRRPDSNSLLSIRG